MQCMIHEYILDCFKKSKPQRTFLGHSGKREYGMHFRQYYHVGVNYLRSDGGIVVIAGE